MANSIAETLQNTVVSARRSNCLVKGLNQCSRQLEQGTAVLCVVSQAIANEQYSNLVPVLCNEREVPLLPVNDARTLAIWAGQARIGQDGEFETARVNTNGCSIVVITRWDENDVDVKALTDYIQSVRNTRR